MLGGGCFSVKAPETIDIDLGDGTSYVGDRRPEPAPAGSGPEALRHENLRLRTQLADTRAQLTKARRRVDDLEDKLEDMSEELDDLRDAIKRAHGGDDD